MIFKCERATESSITTNPRTGVWLFSYHIGQKGSNDWCGLTGVNAFVFCYLVVGRPELTAWPIAFVRLLFGVHRVVTFDVISRRI